MVIPLVHWAGRTLIRLSMRGLERGPGITRFSLYRRLEGRLAPAPEAARVLSVGHSVGLCRVLGLGGLETLEANYPDRSLLDLPFEDETFDFVVSEDVLDHVEGDPRQAVEESLRVLKGGGIAVHYGPRDLWRFSPDGLRLLCGGFSEVLDCGGWGSFPVLAYLWLGLRKEGVPLARWHPVHRLALMDSPTWPIITWIVARK
jgi:SAM-dependent methyltransferase